MKEDDIAGQVTPCCFKVQMNHRQIDADRNGADIFFAADDVTMDMLLPILCRHRMVSTMVVALPEYDDAFLKELVNQLQVRYYINGTWHYLIKDLTLLVVPDVGHERVLERLHNTLQKYADRVHVSRARCSFTAIAFADSLRHRHTLLSVSGHSGNRMYTITTQHCEIAIQRMQSYGRVGEIKGFFTSKEP